MAAKICSKSCLDRTGASGLQSANGLLPLVVLTSSTLRFVCFLVHFILLAPTQRKHTFLFHVHIYRFVQKHGPRQFFRDIVDGLPFRYNYAATLKCSNDYVFVPNCPGHRRDYHVWILFALILSLSYIFQINFGRASHRTGFEIQCITFSSYYPIGSIAMPLYGMQCCGME